MSTITSHTRTLNITLEDEDGGNTTFKINDPVNKEFSLTTIKNIYQPMLTAGYLYSNRYGKRFTKVASAAVVVTEITATELEEDPENGD